MIKKVLIANRGEIAIRIMRTLRKMEITSVALFTHPEASDRHVLVADESYSLGNGTLAETWLNIPKIISLAQSCGADAIHPGYGFLSENASFAKACEDAGIIFIGPSASVIEQMGSKIMASQLAHQAGIPLLPRLEGDTSTLLQKGPLLGFPLLVKAAAGGGGKGMIRIDSAEMLNQAVFSAAEQAKRYFADDTVYLEKYVENPRHIEVQILADHHGNVVHLFERECTLQRHHQKVIEEAPSVSLTELTRAELCDAAVSLAASVGYRNAGTVEFILDEKGNFFFLEMNTRIQVEHPVTEMITGKDLVEEQIRIARGEKLGFGQDDLSINGHAIEARLYAEDPANHFMPSAGKIQKIVWPQNQKVRIDSAISDSGLVHSSFDAMVAKIITHTPERASTIKEMDNALGKILVHGITSNIGLLSAIMKDEDYQKNQISTHTIYDKLSYWDLQPYDDENGFMASALFIWMHRYDTNSGAGAWRMASIENLKVNGNKYELHYFPSIQGGLSIVNGNNKGLLENISITGNKTDFLWNKNEFSVVFNYSVRNAMYVINGAHYHVLLPQLVPLPRILVNGKHHRYPDVKASLYGKVLRVNVTENQQVKVGETLLVIESMKMENSVLAPSDTIISRINVKEGDQVSDGQVLISFES